ncbi:MAG TPA: DUF1800 domain-containing protein [Flavilitoribacter sp.]|nr:DUF1800 domain-containing protein [Flavilitoribacter sp.]
MSNSTTLTYPLSAPPVVLSGLEPYSGPWEYEQAAHLLRRTTFGPTRAVIRQAVDQGLAATIEQLFEDMPMPEPPVNPAYDSDPNVAIGESWVDKGYSSPNPPDEMEYRERSLFAWTIGQMMNEEISIREKLTLFWHNHFPIAAIEDPRYMYRYITTLRAHAWGNFKELAKAITIDPSMLIYLNGNRNSFEAPNENYARELLELFTIGKGPSAGPGDYTNYTEHDVREMARVLSGWEDYGFTAEEPDSEVGAEFKPEKHDTGTKTLSHRFGNKTITNMGEDEYSHLIDVIFEQDQVARFIARRLYIWFVDYKIEEDAETDVIGAMAQILIDNNYEIKPALQTLFGSQHFFDMRNKGLMIKNPIDFLLSIYKPLEISLPEPTDQKYDAWYRVFGFADEMKMSYFQVPEVAGWDSYYREPLFYRLWINSTTLPIRMRISETLIMEGYFPFGANGPKMHPDLLGIIATFSNPTNPNVGIDEFAQILLPMPITDGQKAALKELLIPGLPDFEWTLEYGEYAANPDNSDLANAIDEKVRIMVKTMLSMAEFYLS